MKIRVIAITPRLFVILAIHDEIAPNEILLDIWEVLDSY